MSDEKFRYFHANRESKGIDPDKVPLWGLEAKDRQPENCRIEYGRECGCGLGQCENGLVF